MAGLQSLRPSVVAHGFLGDAPRTVVHPLRPGPAGFGRFVSPASCHGLEVSRPGPRPGAVSPGAEMRR